jgi:RND family efflux transporter MFP subunit
MSGQSSTARTGIIAFAVIVVALAAGYAWWALSERQVPAADPGAAAVGASRPAPDGSVSLTIAQLRAQGVETAPIQPATVLVVEGLPAQAVAPLSASAQVAAPYSGVVTRILVDEGSEVRHGQALARILSQDVLSAQAALARARTEAAAADLQAGRDAALLAEGIIPAARNEQTQARAAAAQSTLRESEGALARLRPVPGGQAGEYELLAPMSGQVIRRHVQPGQAVAALETAFVVAEAGRIDVVFSAPLRLRDALLPGLEVRLPDDTTAQVVAVGADADSSSQSLRVRARVDAGRTGSGHHAVGQQFSVRLLLPAPEGSLSVPSSALLPTGSGHVLHVAEARREGNQDVMRIRAVTVELLGHDASFSAVRALPPSGGAPTPVLAADMQVVTRGTALLKSMLPAR